MDHDLRMPIFEFVDQYKNKVCGVCVDGILPAPYSCWLDDNRNRIYGWLQKPNLRTLLTFDEYLRDPCCTPDRHYWWEQAFLAESFAAYRNARRNMHEMVERPAGWSII